MKNTKPFPYQYKITDMVTRRCVFKTANRKELYHVYRNDYLGHKRDVEYQDCDAKYPWIYTYAEERYEVTTHFGNKVSWAQMDRDFGPKRRGYGTSHNKIIAEHKAPDIRYKKGNPNKIKRGYYNTDWKNGNEDNYEMDYITCGYFRGFSVMPERRRNCGDVLEYGQTIVRGRRRAQTLPDPYDDYVNQAAEEVTSWKRHSKRKHQYKVKEPKYFNEADHSTTYVTDQYPSYGESTVYDFSADIIGEDDDYSI